VTDLHAQERALHEAAREVVGVPGDRDPGDFGDDAYLEGLRVLLSSLDEEAKLNPLGVQIVRGMMVDALVSRLFSERGWAAHPECADASIERPLVILGLPRTGTTALHHLLSQDPALQGLERWLAETPKPRPARDAWTQDAQFRRCHRRLRATYELTPEMKSIHFMAADLVDECWYLLAQSFAHSSWEANTHAPGYSRWFAEHDARPDYLRHRRNLQLIGHREPDRRWLLKDSTHLFNLRAFLDVYPDACIVQTHRDPVKAIASVCSLCWSARKPLNQPEDRHAFGRATLALWERAILGRLAVRRDCEAAQFFDLPFEALVSDPLASIDAIYEHFGIERSEAADARMRAFRGENPQHKHGVHAYGVEDWGLDADEIRERFAPYIEAFDVPPG
jgi:hypothetical protein